MNDFIRKQKVNELNRLLPMVRETIRKEKKINSLIDERDRKEEELEKVEKTISQLEFLIITLSEEKDFSKPALEEFQLVLDAQKKKQEELVIPIADYNTEIDKYTDEFEFETRLYKSITSIIATAGGFLKNEEIQEEFLE